MNDDFLDALRLAHRLSNTTNQHFLESPPMRLPYGPRHGSTDLKDVGFYGPLKNGDAVMSEYSSDRDFQYPSIHQGMSPADLAATRMHERMRPPHGDDIISQRLEENAPRIPFPEDVDQRAYEAAQSRRSEGRSPFFEQGHDAYPAWSPDQNWPEPAIGAPEREHLGGGGAAIKNAMRLLGRLFPEGSGYAGVPGKPSTVHIPGIGRVEARPIPEVERAAVNATRASGGNGAPITSFPQFNPAFAAKVAEAFEAMKHNPGDPAVKRAYEALIDDTLAQYRAAKDTGIDFKFLKPGEADPYAANPALGYADIVNNGRLVMFPTDQGFGTVNAAEANNPLLKRVGRIGDKEDAVANDAFRIVHDLYGHHGPGNPFFRAPGEERAFQLHSQMYSPEALPAATAETRGQNSWVNYGPHGEANRASSGADTTYADQKVGRMPDWAGAPVPDVGTDIEGYVRGLTGKAEGGAVEELPPEVLDALRSVDRERAAEPTLQEYRPNLQERIAAPLMGDSRPSPERRRMAEGLAELSYYLPGVGEAIAGDRAGRSAATGEYLKALRALLGGLPGMGKAAYTGAKKTMPLDDFDDVLRLADKLHGHAFGGEVRAHRGPGGEIEGDVSFLTEPPPVPFTPPPAPDIVLPVEHQNSAAAGIDLPSMAQDPDQQIQDALRIAAEHRADQLRRMPQAPESPQTDLLEALARRDHHKALAAKKEYAPFDTLPLREDEAGIHFDPHAGLLGKIGRGLGYVGDRAAEVRDALTLANAKKAAQAVPGIAKGLAEGVYESTKSGVTFPHDVVTGAVDPMSDEGLKRALDLAGLAGTGSLGGSAPEGALRSGLQRTSPLAETFEAENIPSVVASPRPGKGAHPPIVPEGELKKTGFDVPPEDWMDQFGFDTPDILGAGLPPSIQAPLHNDPQLDNIVKAMGPIFRNPKLHDVISEVTGLPKGGLKITPTIGTWLGEREPSFVFEHPEMTPESANKLAELLGFGMQQDAAVAFHHNPSHEEGFRTALIGTGKKLTSKQVDAIAEHAAKEGVDFTLSKDGKAAKFLFMGDENEFEPFADAVQRIADASKMKELYHARSKSDLVGANKYLPEVLQPGGAERVAGLGDGEKGLQGGPSGPSDLFGRIVDHLLAPFGRAVAGEGFRLSPERLGQIYGLSPAHVERVRKATLPRVSRAAGKNDRSTVPLMEGTEELDIRPTGVGDKATVDDVLFALQNRAARMGHIEPGDFSKEASKSLAEDIAREVDYHVRTSGKSAIGWYDEALKKAKELYHEAFPELKTDRDAELKFDALLGITSQGNDVHSNSVFAARLYDLTRGPNGLSLPEAVKRVAGSMGQQTRAIEQNLLKFDKLIEKNGLDDMRKLFNETKTVGEWNKILKKDPRFDIGGKKLEMQGAAEQPITGWMVFGPKIGSFINNLHGDYSTLTADLWFSRTWNRLLGHNFVHSPGAEPKQFSDYRDALRAEFEHHNSFPWEQRVQHKTSSGQFQRDKNTGQFKKWLHGTDVKDMPRDKFEKLIRDPQAILEHAKGAYEKYWKSGYKEKSDLRRRAKNWMENRELAVAAPRGDKERWFQQQTVEEAQKLLKKKYGKDISVADIQAALWFHEKEMFAKYGVAPERAQPADYADAAKNTLELIRKGDLFKVASKEKKAKGKKAPERPPEEPPMDDEEGMARGGSIVPLALRLADKYASRH